MLMRSDPFRELDRLAQQALGTRMQPAAMPMDAYRDADHIVVSFDVPGVEPSTIDVTVEKDVLRVSAERTWEPGDGAQVLTSERPNGSFTRELFLGEGLDTDHVEATCTNGVLTVSIPVGEHAKARKVQIASGGRPKAISSSAS